MLVAKSWFLVYKTPIYVIDALKLQTPRGTGLSILDAKGGLVFVALYKNNRCLIKPQLMQEEKVKSWIDKYKNMGSYIQYKSVSIFTNLIFHIKYFQKINSIHTLEPFYIKKPL
jgi:tRNA A37 threonylcarbamoyladenosine modification protein TsaB